jgi:acetyltransferase-like isoleucine patch superfamily enzyme
MTIKIYNKSTIPKPMLTIEEYSHVYSTFNLMTNFATISIGKRCQIGNVNFIIANKIIVGDDVLMAWGITIMDNDSHSLNWDERKNDSSQGYRDYMQYGNIIETKDWSKVVTKPISIQNRVWIGFNASILKGVTIGENAVIGACSIVTNDVPPYSVVAGNPARVIRKL